MRSRFQPVGVTSDRLVELVLEVQRRVREPARIGRGVGEELVSTGRPVTSCW